MCGLAGFQSVGAGKLNVLRAKMLLQYLSESRGKDSTGIFSPEIGVVKNADTASKFIEGMYNSKSIDFAKLSNSSIFIGHVRQKTHGERKATNAHPFRYQNIIGAHNGVITNHHSLIPDNHFPIDYPVDSMVIFSRLQIDNNFKVLSEMIGAAAILFYNLNEPEALYAYRNNDRPLCYGSIEGEGIYFGSTEESLKVIDCADIKELKENILYKFVDGKIKTNWKIARANDPDSLFITKFNELKDLKDLFGFNLLLKTTDTSFTKGLAEEGNEYVYVKTYTKNVHSGTLSTFQVDTCKSFEDKEAPKLTYLSDLDINSYNAFFKKGNIVRAVRDFNYVVSKKNRNKKPQKACIKHELFTITGPLLKRTDRSVTVTSLLDPKKSLIIDVAHLEAVVNSKILEQSAKEIGLKLEDEVAQIETLIDSVTDEEVNKYKGISEERLFGALDKKLRNKLNLESEALNSNQFRSIIEEQLQLDFEDLSQNTLTKSLEKVYNQLGKLKTSLASMIEKSGDDVLIGDIKAVTYLDELEQLSLDLISIYDNHSLENNETYI